MDNIAVPPSRRLAFQQARLAVVFGLALGVVLSLVQIGNDYVHQRQALDTTLQRLLSSVQATAANAVWNLDRNQAQSILDGVFTYSIFIEGRIRSFKGDFLVSKQRAPSERPWQWLSDQIFGTSSAHTVTLTYGKSAQHGAIGEFSVVVDPYDEALAFLQRSGIILLSGVVRNLLLALMLLAAFYYSLTRPLSKIIGFVSALNPKTAIPGRLEVGRAFQGELAVLADSLNRMIEESNQGICDRQRIQQELEQLNRDLERRVSKKTAALSEEKRRADQASAAKSRFLATMSHELRTPLNAILGYAQILGRDPAISERQADGLRTIEHSGQHLLTLINDVLDLAKVEAGKMELQPRPVELLRFLSQLTELIGIKAQQKGIVFRYVAPTGSPLFVLLDDRRLRQVLLNLLGNAIKFTDQGEIRLEVQILDLSPEQAHLRFTVRDSGVGIDAQQLGRIFNPFEQVGDAERQAGGTGLGLAICHQLLQLMGSEIRVDSSPGEGSRFDFELRLALASGAGQAAIESIPAGYQGPSRTILVVDDVEDNRAMVVEFLRGLGLRIDEARNGQEAIELAQRSPPDLIVMDLMMPVLGGEEATRRMRGDAVLSAIPIIMISASAIPGDEAHALAAGANAFLVKPIDQQALVEKIGALLQLRWCAPTAQPASGKTAPAVLLIPPQEQLKALHGLARAGDMRGIRHAAEQVEELGAQYRPFAERLRGLAKGYQSKALLELIETYYRERTP